MFCSALKDSRFQAIRLDEVPYLECGVSLLTDFEHANNYMDWEASIQCAYIHIHVCVCVHTCVNV